MTDPTLQAGQCKCGHHINFHSTMRRLDCLTYGCSCAAFTPAEPSPAPPAEDDLTQLYEEAKRNGAGTYSGSHIIPLIEALTAAREERDQYKESFNVECDRREGCLDQLTTMREERDRHKEALEARLLQAETGFESEARRAEKLEEERDRAQDALRDIYGQVVNGRLCYFGDSTGYTPQIGSHQVEQWAKILGLSKPVSDRQPEGETK